MKRKVFASVLATLMVMSSFSSGLMADINEETFIPEETESIIDETEEAEAEEVSEIAPSEESIEEFIEENEEAQEDLVQEEALDNEEVNETEDEEVFDETEENNEELVAPVYEEYEAPGTDALAATSITLKLGDKATGYLSDTDNDGLNDKLEIKGTGALYDLNSVNPKFAFLSTVEIASGITSIGSNMFDGCSLISWVNIPDTVTKIGDHAFRGTGLTGELKIPKSVKTIGAYAFQYCEKIEEIEFKSGTETIGEYAFDECTRLRKVTFSNTIKTLGEGSFKKTRISGELIFPESVRTIGNRAFEDCMKIDSLVFKNGVETIGDYAFYNSEVKSITFPNTLKSIGNYAFCRNPLKTVTFPNSLKSIGDYAFSRTHIKGTLTIPGNVKTIGESAFSNNYDITQIVINSGTETIGKSAFYYCNFATKVTLPNTITTIGDYAFSSCEALEQINIPNSITYIPNYCFYECGSLTKVTLPKNIKKIGNHAYDRCYNLVSITLNDSIESIGDRALCKTKITAIDLPSSITHIGDYAFEYTNIISIVLPEKITAIPIGVFQYSSIQTVECKGTITQINAYAFADCHSLKTFVVPNSVTYIGDGAFSGTWIEKLVFESSNVRFGKYVIAAFWCDELVVPCNFLKEFEGAHITKTIVTHTFDHASDTKCNYCGLIREVHPITMDQFVERLYTTCLGRKSEVAGKEYWIKKLINGATGAEAAHQFFFSSEFTSKKLSDKEFITRLYKTFMDRNPDTNGLNYWLGKIKSGYTREQVFQGFINSQEWADMCLEYGILSGGSKAASFTKEPSKGCVDFATRLYTTCLGRKPDEAGLKDWVTKLTTLKTTGTKAAHGFFFSKEFTSKNYSNEEYIKRLYRTFMGREADQGGINYWLGKIKGGYTREQVFQGFANSAEFEKICVQYGILK